MNSKLFERYFIGDDCVAWSFGDEIDIETNKKVLNLYQKLKQSPLRRQFTLYDIVPSYKAVAVYFDPAADNLTEMLAQIEAFILDNLDSFSAQVDKEFQEIILPVVYDGEDIGRVASLHSLSIADVVRKHTAPAYRVAMVGFKPHFPYLMGLDPDLITSRLDTPRSSIPAGAVGIGGAQTGVYPEVSPGGWNIIGRTNPNLLQEIKPGDWVRMKEVGSL